MLTQVIELLRFLCNDCGSSGIEARSYKTQQRVKRCRVCVILWYDSGREEESVAKSNQRKPNLTSLVSFIKKLGRNKLSLLCI